MSRLKNSKKVGRGVHFLQDKSAVGMNPRSASDVRLRHAGHYPLQAGIAVICNSVVAILERPKPRLDICYCYCHMRPAVAILRQPNILADFSLSILLQSYERLRSEPQFRLDLCCPPSIGVPRRFSQIWVFANAYISSLLYDYIPVSSLLIILICSDCHNDPGKTALACLRTCLLFHQGKQVTHLVIETLNWFLRLPT